MQGGPVEDAQAAAAFMSAVPIHSSDPRSVAEIGLRAGFEPNRAESVGNLLLAILAPFDLFERVSDSEGAVSIRLRSESAKYFIESWSKYVLRHDVLVSDWERDGLSEGPWTAEEVLRGAQLTFIAESHRMRLDANAEPVRTSRVSQLVLKGRLVGLRGDRYLMRYDDKARAFQLIGGHSRTGEEPLETMLREIAEELPGIRRSPKQMDLRQLGRVKVSEVSRTMGAITSYDMRFFVAAKFSGPVAISPADRWVSLDEMRQGFTSDKVRVNARGLLALNDILAGGVAGIPRTLESSAFPSLRQFLVYRRWELISVAIGLAGIVVSLLLAL